MKAVRRTEAGVETIDVDDPDGSGVVLDVAAAGICGSDLHMVGFGPLPVTLGHEFAGVDSDGNAFAVDPAVTCGTCPECARGDVQLCSGPRSLLGIGVDGGMAERTAVPEDCLVPLSAGVEAGNASLVEPLAVAVHGLGMCGLEAGMRVAVVGAGTIGLCAIPVAADSGVTVDLSARHAHQREAGERLGAHADVTRGYDVVVEAAGSPTALRRACEIARPGGTVLVLGVHWGTMRIPGPLAVSKELRVVSSISYGHRDGIRDIDRAAQTLASHADIPDALVTHRFSLEDAAEAFRVAADRASGAIKVVIQP